MLDDANTKLASALCELMDESGRAMIEAPILGERTLPNR
jgi:hypothetical protein